MEPEYQGTSQYRIFIEKKLSGLYSFGYDKGQKPEELEALETFYNVIEKLLKYSNDPEIFREEPEMVFLTEQEEKIVRGIRDQALRTLSLEKRLADNT